ncbi:MAG: imidazolonepropionase [Victivallales bacterium]|nr:imidazolonepropionase [Victivallales bacterium]
MKSKTDLIITNSSKLVALKNAGNSPLTGKNMQNLGIIENGAVAVNNDKIIETGTSSDIEQKYSAENIIDAEKNLVMPGLVDPHTHLVFGGSREHELVLKIKGASYLEILASGGGINSTVEATRETSEEKLIRSGRKRVNQLLAHGTTTIEIKTGYGLEPEAEEKCLRVINQLKEDNKANIISTFLGAHIVPKDWDKEDYIHWIVNEGLENFSGLAEFCDIFTEKNAYNLDDTKNILSKAKELGYKLKIHSGQFTDLGATGLAAELGAVSADHLEQVSDEQLDTMKKSGTAAVLMPGVNFFLMDPLYADAERMINNGNIVALATDFNPGSCPSYSMQMMIALACYHLKMTPEEAIAASTINAAYAVDRGGIAGSLNNGKSADIIVLNVEEPAHIPYYFGTNLVKHVIKSGKQIF